MSVPTGLRVAQRFAGLSAWLLLWTATGCVKRLPPAPIPAATIPPVALAGPPPEGMGRLVVDVVEGPTRIERVKMSSQPVDLGDGRVAHRIFDVPEVFCQASPCAVDVPPGNVLLRFPVIGDPRAAEVELVHVALQPTVYRRALSRYSGKTGGTRVFGIISTSVGAAAAVTGAVLLPVGLGGDHDTLASAGAISLGVGAVLMTVGIWAIRSDSPTYQPGSSAHYPLVSGGPGAAN